MMYEMGKGNCGHSEDTLLNVNQENSTKIPNTPEILSALSKLHPLDEYMTRQNSVIDDKIFSSSEYNSADTCSSTSSNIGSPSSPVSLQNMRSQLIKEDLKMRLRQKAREKRAPISIEPLQVATPCNSLLYEDSYLDLDENDDNSSNGDSFKTNSELTPEDQERRSRRRERNKIAASKCREKKRQRTKCLENDSVKLEELNKKIKYDIEKLETQKQKLVVLLHDHKPSCLEPSPEPSPVTDYQQAPTFVLRNVANANSALLNAVDKTVLHQRENEVTSSNSVPSSAPDFHGQFSKKPPITLPVPENVSYSSGRHSVNYLPQQMLLDTNFRYNVPNLSFLDEPNNNYYEISYVDGAENGCMV